MCFLLRLDHITCGHSTALEQHCVNAPLSKIRGTKRCSKIRQHSRPILTRQKCAHCNGPRYFARRGGLADRGGKNNAATLMPHERMESHDSGYVSDVIHEEDEEDEGDQGDEEEEEDYALSPRASRAVKPKQREQPKPPARLRSPGRRPSWRPNLKRELRGDHTTFYRRESIDSTISTFDDSTGRATPAPDSESSRPVIGSIVLQPPPSQRRGSSLLHPSSPPTEENVVQEGRGFPLSQLTPPSTPPQRGPSERKESTLLHPSSPRLSTPLNVQEAKSFQFPFPLPTPTSPNRPTTPPQRPDLQPRKNSTLLHPSSPPDMETPFNQPTSFSGFPFPTERKKSVIHSCLSDDEWDQPLHSAHSDGEFEFDDDDDDEELFEDERCGSGNSSPAEFEALAQTAQTAKMARASRVELNNHHMRMLREA